MNTFFAKCLSFYFVIFYFQLQLTYVNILVSGVHPRMSVEIVFTFIPLALWPPHTTVLLHSWYTSCQRGMRPGVSLSILLSWAPDHRGSRWNAREGPIHPASRQLLHLFSCLWLLPIGLSSIPSSQEHSKFPFTRWPIVTRESYSGWNSGIISFWDKWFGTALGIRNAQLYLTNLLQDF